MWLGAWKGGIPLPGRFCWSSGPFRIFKVWFGSSLQLKQNWSEAQAKADAHIGTWLWRWLFLKGRAEVCAVYISPLTLYQLYVLPQPKNHWLALQWSFSKLLWGGWRLIVHRQVCCQCLHNGGLDMPGLETIGSLKDWFTWVDSCQRTQCWDKRWAIPFFTLSQTLKLKVDISLGVKHRLSGNAVRPITTFLDPVTFLGLERSCIRI